MDTDHLTQGEVIAFVNYMTQISLALVVVANLVVIFTKAGASATRINQVFDTKPHMQEGKVTIEDLEQEKGDGISQKPIISLREIYFAYPDSEEYALENITFDVMPGETIGIIGGTGSGKSTLVNLLPRLYDATKGELLINGLDIKEYSYDTLRRQFGIAPQKTVLFSGSIRDNLRMAKEDATDEEIRRAIRISQSEEFVETLSKGYDSEISQGGKNLSGGQRQRLTIARALIRNPKILILDDSASALDYSTEAKLRKALYTECGGMTIIMVSQRAGSIRHADKIIVMDDGKIAGIGTHNQLIKSCEVYREICHSQPGMEEVTEA